MENARRNSVRSNKTITVQHHQLRSPVPVEFEQDMNTTVDVKPEIKVEQDEADGISVQYQFLDFGSSENSAESEQLVCDVEKSSLVSAREDCTQKQDFFGSFGLIKKSEMPVNSHNESRLHRNRGGKLRRIVKQKVHNDMMPYLSGYRKVSEKNQMASKTLSLSKFNKSASKKLRSKQLSHNIPRSQHVLTVSDNLKVEKQNGKRTGAEKATPKTIQTKVEKVVVAMAPALHPQLMTSVARSPMRTLAKMSEIESREKKGLPIDGLLKQVEQLNKKPKGVAKPLYEPVSRRSSRLQGKQKEWKHLLKV